MAWRPMQTGADTSEVALPDHLNRCMEQAAEVWDVVPAECPHTPELIDDPMPAALEVAELRYAANAFKDSAGLGVDRMRPRHVGRLSDGALEALAHVCLGVAGTSGGTLVPRVSCVGCTRR